MPPKLITFGSETTTLAENGETRSKTAHRTPGQIHREATGYNHRPEQIRNREERNKARAAQEKAGRVHKGDGMEVDHKKPLIKGGSNAAGNQQVITREANRKKSDH